jgi:hypothetical protein
MTDIAPTQQTEDQQPAPENATGVSTPPDDGNVTSTAPPVQENGLATNNQVGPTSPQTTGQATNLMQAPANSMQAPANVQSQTSQPSKPPVNPFWDRVKSTARGISEEMAGGPRNVTTVDPDTGETTTVQQPLSGRSIGLALAMEALAGGLSGLAAHGPNALGQAAAIGVEKGQKIGQQRSEAQTAADKQSLQNQWASYKANQEMFGLAQEVGKQDYATHTDMVKSHAATLEYLKSHQQESIGATNVAEQDALDFKKFPVDQYIRIPDGVIPRTGPDGKPVYVDLHGNVVNQNARGARQAWDNSYTMVKNDATHPAVDENGTPLANAAPDFKMPIGVSTSQTNQNTSVNVGKTIRDQRSAEADEYLQNHASTSGNANATNSTNATGASNGPSVPSADVQGKINAAATKYGVDPALATAVALQESGGNPGTKPSSKGAIGIFQLMPQTAKGLNVDPNNPDQNIDGGVNYLSQLIKQYNGNTKLALAAYNAGPQNVKNAVPVNGQTEAYVPAVLKRANYSPDGSKPQSQNATNGPADASTTGSFKDSMPDYNKAINLPIVGGPKNWAGTQQRFEQAVTKNKQNLVEALGSLDSVDAARVRAMYGPKTDEIFSNHDKQQVYQKEKDAADIKETASVDTAEKKSAQADQDTIARNKNLIDAGARGEAVDISKVVGSRANVKQVVYDAIKAKNPNFNPSDNDDLIALKKEAIDGHTQGSLGLTTSSSNTMLQHIANADVALTRLEKNSGYIQAKAANQLNTWFSNNFSNPDVSTYQTEVQAAKDDWQNTLKNGHAPLSGESEHADSLIDINSPTANQHGALHAMARTGAIRMVQQNDARWQKATGEHLPGLVAPATVDALRQLNDPEVNRSLAEADSGGTLVGGPKGMGAAGKSVGDMLTPAAPKKGQAPTQDAVNQYTAMYGKNNPAKIVAAMKRNGWGVQ